MAIKTGVPVVPISLSHTHAVMPGNALFPVQAGKGKLHVHVHDAIPSSDKTEAQLQEIVKETLLSTMPEYQHPLPKEETVEQTEPELLVV